MKTLRIYDEKLIPESGTMFRHLDLHIGRFLFWLVFTARFELELEEELYGENWKIRTRGGILGICYG